MSLTWPRDNHLGPRDYVPALHIGTTRVAATNPTCLASAPPRDHTPWREQSRTTPQDNKQHQHKESQVIVATFC